MALPTLTKTWQIQSNIAVGGTGNGIYDNAQWLYTIKSAFVEAVQGAWTVVSSCAYRHDIITPAWVADNNDNWTQWENIQYTTQSPSAVRPWIVLKQTAIGPNFQVCFDRLDLANGYHYRMEVWVSESAGFTGGATNARPTAPDEYRVLYYSISSSSPGNIFSARLHTWVSTDGEVTRIVGTSGGGFAGFIDFSRAKNPNPQWTVPWVGVWNMTATSYNNYCDETKYYTRRGPLYVTGEGTSADALGDTIRYPDELLGGNQYGIYPMGIASTTYGFVGRKGEMADMWWISGGQGGSTLPDDTSRQFLAVTDFLLPWDGSVPLFT